MEQNECSQSMRQDAPFPPSIDVKFENGEYQSVPTNIGDRHSCILNFSRVPYLSFFTSIADNPGETHHLIRRFVDKYQNKCYKLKYKSTRRNFSLRKPYMKKPLQQDRLKKAIDFVNKNDNMYYISNVTMPTAESAFPVLPQTATAVPHRQTASTETHIPIAEPVTSFPVRQRTRTASRGGKKSRKRRCK